MSQICPVEFMCRVKLPSGDADYAEAFRAAILAVKPVGFEVRWPKLNEKWAVDSEGYTLVPLYLTDEKQAVAYWMDRGNRAEKRLKEIQDAIRRLL